MTTLPQLCSTLAKQPGPALTFYGRDRVELGGPVLARWLTKTANLLGNDLSPAIMGGPTAGSIVVDLGLSWQAVTWRVASALSGWTLTDEAMADLRIHPAFTAATAFGPLEASPWVLLQDLGPLSFSWPGVLPEGTVDALAELMAQSDSFDIDVSALTVTVDDYLGQLSRVDVPGGVRVAWIGTDVDQAIAACLRAWLTGGSIVLIDRTYHADCSSICAAEGATALAPDKGR